MEPKVAAGRTATGGRCGGLVGADRFEVAVDLVGPEAEHAGQGTATRLFGFAAQVRRWGGGGVDGLGDADQFVAEGLQAVVGVGGQQDVIGGGRGRGSSGHRRYSSP